MAAKPKRKSGNEDKAQSCRFVKTARALEADESGNIFERAHERIMHKPSARPKSAQVARKKSAS